MIHTQDGAADTAGPSLLVVDFAGRLKDLHATPARRSKINSRPSTVHILPPRTARAPRHASGEPRPPADAAPGHAMVSGRLPAQLPAWVRALTTRRILVIGAAACYALILFNLVYGIASLSRMKSGHPVQAANASELQREMAPPVDTGRRLDLPLAASPAVIAPAPRHTAAGGNRPGHRSSVARE